MLQHFLQVLNSLLALGTCLWLQVNVKIQRIENEALPAEQYTHYIQLVKGAWHPGETRDMMEKLREFEEQRRRGSRGANSAYRRKDGGDEGR